MPSLQFFGATDTVTGSRFLLSGEQSSLLLDCGLFQGGQEEKRRNWDDFPAQVDAVDAIVLTHAHLDHSGGVPRLMRRGYHGPVYCTAGTADLLALLWPDAGFLQEEEAHHAERRGWSRHAAPEPLFTVVDAQRALRLLRPMHYEDRRDILPGVSLRYRSAGHIIGAASAEVEIDGMKIVFSGDLGRDGMALLKAPSPVRNADILVVESTYGDRRHPHRDPHEVLAEVVREAAHRGGMLVIPSFAIGRTQEVLLILRELEDAGAIPVLDVFVDSPMAVDATAITQAHSEDFNPMARAMMEGGALTPRKLHLVRDVAGSKALNTVRGPGIILSASGMATGGRIKHHLQHRLPDPHNTVCLVGYQAAGTRGRLLEEGATQVWIFGEAVPVRAHVTRVDGMSGHADSAEILTWLAGFAAPPRATYIVHGEKEARETLAQNIYSRMGWNVMLPNHGETVELGVSLKR